MIKLWPHQESVVGGVREALKRHKSICIVMPTGSGKTAVASDLVLKLMRQVSRQLGKAPAGIALFLVHRKELLDQTCRTFERIGMGDSYGLVAANHGGKPWRPIQICSIPTLKNRLDDMARLLDGVKVIFIDEAHHARATTWERVVNKWPDAIRIGLTATPARSDELGLKHIFDELVVGPTIKELTPEYLAPMRTVTIGLDTMQRFKTIRAEEQSIVTGPVIANVVESWFKHARHRKTIFFCINVEHSRLVCERLRERGVAAAHLDFKTPAAERERVLRQASEGSVQCITNAKLFTEGTDWPECDCVVLARATGSTVDFKQMVGRGMRRKSGGGDSLLLDLAGNVWDHGLPDADVEWSLDHGIEREEKRKAASSIRRCLACGHAYVPARDDPARCPICGEDGKADANFVEVDAELTELKAPSRKATGMRRDRQREEVIATGGDIAKLKAIAKREGYKPGWPWMMKRAYAHHWGRGRT